MSGGEEGDVRVWEIKTRQMVLHLKEHKMAVTALQICDADMCVLSSSRDCSILKWDLTRGERVAALRQRMGGINGIVLQGDGTPYKPFQMGRRRLSFLVIGSVWVLDAVLSGGPRFPHA